MLKTKSGLTVMVTVSVLAAFIVMLVRAWQGDVTAIVPLVIFGIPIACLSTYFIPDAIRAILKWLK